MLDVVGALVFGVVLAADLAVLIGWGVVRPGARLAAFAIAGTWITIIVAIGAMGGFARGILGPFPTPVFAFLILVVGGLLAWFNWRPFRDALLAVPLAGLIGINAARVVGICFLFLHAQGRLAAPFATSAGWGDIITGIVAVPLALMVWKGEAPRWLLRVWNGFGALDLITAITLGALSAPGTPFRVFTEEPGTFAMGTLPWVGIPALLVPLYLITHMVIAVRLRAEAVSTDKRGPGWEPETAVRRIA